MDGLIRTTSLLPVVLVILMPDPCTLEITPDVTLKNCPTLVISECKRGLKWDNRYAKISSKKFNTTYLCDTKTDGGGWIVIQTWKAYKNGFGPVCSDYWLGNKYIHSITNSGQYELRIDMVHNSKGYFASYDHFYVEDEDKNYALHIGNFTGNTKDDLKYHNGKPFSTPDKDNDPWPVRHCAQSYDAGWWYSKCLQANLNGPFDNGGMLSHGVVWIKITGAKGVLSAVEMKIRNRSDGRKKTQ